MNNKQLLKNTLEEQKYQRQQLNYEQRKRTLQQEQEQLEEQNKAFQMDEYQRKIQQKEKQKQLSQAYDQSIQRKKDQQNQEKMKQIQDEYDLVNQAREYQDWQKQSKANNQLVMKRLADASLEDKMRQKNIQQELQQQEKLREQMNYQEQQYRSQIKEEQYKNYYKNVSNQQDQMAKIFQQKYYNPKQQEIDQFINKGIEDLKQKGDYEEQQKRLRQLQNKQNMHDMLQMQIKEKEVQQSRQYKPSENFNESDVWIQEKNKKREEQQRYHEILDKQMQIKSNGFKESQIRASLESPQNLNIHNPILNPIPTNNQNPYLKSPLGQYGNQVLKMY